MVLKMKEYASQKEQPRQQPSDRFITDVLNQLFFSSYCPGMYMIYL